MRRLTTLPEVGYALTAKGRTALAGLRERYEITPTGQFALGNLVSIFAHQVTARANAEQDGAR